MQSHKRKRHEYENLVDTESFFEKIAILPHTMEILFSLPPEVISRLSMTTRLLHRFYQDECFWKTRFLTDFTRPAFDYDYQWQYIAEYLYRTTQTQTAKHAHFQQLKSFIYPHKDKAWAYYYRAILAQHDELNDPQNIFDNETSLALGIKALDLGDLRSALFLIDYADNKWNESHFDNLIKALFKQLSKQISHPDTSQLLCYTQALVVRYSPQHYKTHCQKLIDMLIRALTTKDMSVADFLHHACDVFRRAAIITSRQATRLSHDKILLASPTTIEVMKNMSEHRLLPPNIQFWLAEKMRSMDTNLIEQEHFIPHPAQTIVAHSEETMEDSSLEDDTSKYQFAANVRANIQ